MERGAGDKMRGEVGARMIAQQHEGETPETGQGEMGR